MTRRGAFIARMVAPIMAAVAFSPPPAGAAVTASFSFQVARAPHPLQLDPALADPAWVAGAVPDGGGPWQNVTTRSAAEHATTIYLLYDDTSLYVGFKAAQVALPIVATQTGNDAGAAVDDFVGIGIDTSGTGTQAYYFETTPRGVRYEQASENVRYRPQWQSAAQVGPGGWRAVMIIPLNVLRLPRTGTQSWRFQFVRTLAAHGEHYVWSWNPLMTDAAVGAWPTFADTRYWASGSGVTIAATKSSRSRARADVFVLESAGAQRNSFEQPNGTFAPVNVRPLGVDLSYPLTPTISFVGTANPDFSNVEIDQETIAPQEFRRQLSEYRPFFSQGADFINATGSGRNVAGSYTGGSNFPFYSPGVGLFDYGTKVEGSFGYQAIGAVNFRGFDQTTGSVFDDSAYGYLHALPDRTFLYWSDGVFAHHGAAGSDSTVEMGAQGRNLKSGFEWYFNRAFETGSWVPQGHASLTQGFLDVRKPNYEVNLGYLDVSPNYNPINGYTANSDIRGPQGYVDFIGTAPGVKNYIVYIAADRFLDRSGTVHQADAQVFLTATLKNGFSLNGVGAAIGELRLYGIPAGPGCSGPVVGFSSFTGYPCYRIAGSAPFHLVSIPIGYRDGTPAPTDVTYSWGPFGSAYVHLFSAATARPIGRKMTLGIEYDGTYERAFSNGVLDSQWLRRISLGYTLSSESSLSVALRSINGSGGFATSAGTNLAVAFHARFRGGNVLYVDFGTPAASATLNRLVVKYVFHTGADAGT